MVVCSLMNMLGTAKTKLKIQAQPINTLARRPENIRQTRFTTVINAKSVVGVMPRHSQLLEKFMGCVMASYLSMLSATSTYVDEYVTTT